MNSNNIIYETDYWIVKLADNQYHLGRCVIDIKSDCGELSALTSEEWEDFRLNVVIKLERVMKKAFGATMFNWSCLMNHAFRVENPKPHIHFHFKPRYKNEVEFGGEVFVDKEFGNHYDNAAEKMVDERLFQEILSEIKQNLTIS